MRIFALIERHYEKMLYVIILLQLHSNLLEILIYIIPPSFTVI